MSEVTRSLKEINAEIVRLDASTRTLSRDAKSLDKSLKLDPTSATLLAAKTQNLTQQIANANAKAKALRETQKGVDDGSIKMAAEDYKALKVQIAAADATAKGLRKTVIETNNAKLTQLQSSMQAVARVAAVLLAAIVALEVSYAKTADAISKASTAYNISAEAFQRSSFVWEQATGDAESYAAALKEMQSKLALVERGSTKTIAAFEKLGISTEDLAGLSASEALDLLLSRLSLIEDADERATMANIVLASSGTYLAQVAGLTADEMQTINAALEEQGVLTDEQVAAGAALDDKLDSLKLQYKEIAATLAMSMVPAMEALVNVAQALAPVIEWLAAAFKFLGAPFQVVFIIALGVLAILPKLIASIKAVNTAIGWLGANPVAQEILIIAVAIALVIILLITLAKWLSEVFGKKWALDVDTTGLSNIATGSTDSTAIENARTVQTQQRGANSQVYYYDNSTQNNTIVKEADIDDVAYKLRTKIRVGGAG